MPSTTIIRWGNPPTGLHNAPIYLGLQTGTFSVPGVQIEARDNLTGADYTEELVAGAYDMGHIGTPPLFAALARTHEYVVVGQGLVRYPPFYLMAPAHVRSLRELTSQVITLNKLHTCPHSIMRTLLRREGMTEDQIRLATLVEGEAIVDAIRRGRTAAAVLWEPYVSYVERVLNWKILAEGRTTMTPSNYGILLYARRALLVRQPEVVQQLVTAYADSVRAARQELAAAAVALQERLPHVPPADIESSLRREAPHWSADTSFDFHLLERVLGELEVQTVVPERFALRDILAEAPRAA